MNWRFYWYMRRSYTNAPPEYLNLEPTNRCNLSCLWCVTSKERDGGLLSLELAQSILEQAREAGVREVRLFLAGEPLLHPRIADFVSMSRAFGLKTVIHTNAMLLDHEKGQALLEAGLDEISFSINGLTESVVRRNQPGADLKIMSSNIMAFLDHKMRENHKTFTILQIIQDENELTKPVDNRAIAALFGSPGPDRILRLAPHGWAGQLDRNGVISRGKKYHPCQPLWQGMSVAWDGQVVLCCGDLNGKVIVGDLKRESLMNVWKGRKIAEIRRLVASDHRESLPLCSQCDAVWWQSHPLKHDLKRLWWRIRGRG